MELDEALKEIDRLKGELKKFDGVDPQQVQRDRQSLSDQLTNLQTEFNSYKQTAEGRINDLTGQLTQRDMKSQFVNSYSGVKGLPEYSDILFNALFNNFEMRDGKVFDKSSNKSLEDAIADYRTKFPAMFAAEGDGSGSGATGSQGSTTTSTTSVVKASESSAIASLNPQDVIEGRVEIALG